MSGQPAVAGQLSVLLMLARTPSQTAALQLLAAGLPGSLAPLTEHAQLARRQALPALLPDPTADRAVAAFALANALVVRHQTSSTLLLSGPAERLADTFGTSLATTTAGLRYARTALQVPLALTGLVDSAVGLDERPVARPHAVPGGFTGSRLRAAYRQGAPAATGAGVTVATLQLGGWSPSDLSTYATAAGIPLDGDQITEVALDGADPTGSDGSAATFEVALDSEAVLATAPAARQRIYFTPNDSADVIDAVNTLADDAAAGQVQVASTSWGSCEPDTAAPYRRAYGAAIDRLVAAGTTLFAASGDAGAYDCSTRTAPDATLAVDFPASYPGTVAVGGTRLSGAAAPYAETGWGPVYTADHPGPPGSYAGDGSGGGASADQPRPSYQQGLATPGRTRLLPDVSSVADPATGLGVYVASAGGWVLGGGTSMSAPTWAGFTAAALSAAGRSTGLGNILPLLYAHPEAFRDVTSGGNGFFAATVGFDQVTGLGTPNWAALTRVLLPAQAAPTGPDPQSAVTPTTPSPSPQATAAPATAGPAPASATPTGPAPTRPAPTGPAPTNPAPASPAPTTAAATAGADPATTPAAPTASPTPPPSGPTVAIDGPLTVQPPFGSSYTLTGTAPASSTVTLHFHRAGTPAGEFAVVRTVSSDAAGRWSRTIAATADYRYYASVGADRSTAVLDQPAPTLAGPASQVAPRGQHFLLHGVGIAGSTAAIHLHRAGTAADDFGGLRTTSIDDAGRWTLLLPATTDYRVFVSRTADGGPSGPTQLFQAR